MIYNLIFSSVYLHFIFKFTFRLYGLQIHVSCGAFTSVDIFTINDSILDGFIGYIFLFLTTLCEWFVLIHVQIKPSAILLLHRVMQRIAKRENKEEKKKKEYYEALTQCTLAVSGLTILYWKIILTKCKAVTMQQ